MNRKDIEIGLERLGIAFESLDKGDVFTADELEEIMGHRRGSVGYGLTLLKFRQRLQAMLHDRGKPATVALIRGELRILHDTEASEYNAMAFRHGIRKASRAFNRLLLVDTRRVAPERRSGHYRAIEVDAKILSAINSTRAKCRQVSIPAGHARQTPGLPPS